MSTRFTIWCETHEVAGPHIRRHHNTAIFMETDSARFFPESREVDAADDWGEFLIEHEYCDLRLRYELHSAQAREERERAKLELVKPTHQLMPTDHWNLFEIRPPGRAPGWVGWPASPTPYGVTTE